MIPSYSPDEIEFIARKLRDKLSASQIANALSRERGSEVTRNMIIGIVHRDRTLREIGFWANPGGRPTGEAAQIKPAKKLKPASSPRKSAVIPLSAKVKRMEPAVPAIRSADYDAASRHVPLADLSRFECRWAVNDAAKGEDHLFCGHPSVLDSPYCAHHALRSVGRGTEGERRADDLLRKVAA
ncbi:GcrA family cell cycle regulator [Aminobacter aganoensis]|uniref:GcrA cell cycle regulator n=1 Tax=Aminobacter aganoensis TaxID=83264 RepID=A0A7X0F5I7_9HYPH|nr:GcrA family cell cycle regulator [Aminobacter aganoensis]MBB6353512.1 hypothetical protein [Aminobacter aganoensis]